MNSARLIVDPPQSGARNMAIDRALLQTASEHGQIALRFYQWSSPTISLGYFQKATDRASHTASEGCDWVRRASGGGAILHHHDLTYSICVPAEHPIAKRNTDLYGLVHQCLIESLATFDIKAQQASGPIAASQKQSAFLCFQRITGGDLLVGNSKIGGSAQRRDRQALLQHGSLLLQQSKFAPELPGLLELCESTLDVERMIQECACRIAKELELTFQPSAMSDIETNLAAEIEQSVFTRPEWNLRR